MKIIELEESKSEKSLEWEMLDGWEKIVSEAVIKYPLAPREARAILEVFGIIKQLGLNVTNIAENILNMNHKDLVGLNR